ncbi:hypothetical protein [Pseudomonas sp.]|uniref:hypothetical protein n=1 Tax=Pseudomonas sp. TaxID=306 RepID=UPI003265E022
MRLPPTVYAFLNPKFPSATWDFFCPEFDLGVKLQYWQTPREIKAGAKVLRR